MQVAVPRGISTTQQGKVRDPARLAGHPRQGTVGLAVPHPLTPGARGWEQVTLSPSAAPSWGWGTESGTRHLIPVLVGPDVPAEPPEQGTQHSIVTPAGWGN